MRKSIRSLRRTCRKSVARGGVSVEKSGECTYTSTIFLTKMTTKLEDTQLRRRDRYHRRETEKAFKGSDRICTICQEPIEHDYEAEITSCGHTFHAKCGHENRKFLFIESLNNLREMNADVLVSSPELRAQIAKNFFEYEAGISCPNCRQPHPFAYRLAKKATFKNKIYRFPNLTVHFSANDVLQFVSR